ncbi:MULTISPECIES: DUF559 domain-containing protein [unclassified Arthrobacter]|uniref:DUF559 domain-containing protein n=1 Tax=unclassified Arthrobacter TaxID=235627 RepID=UPI00159D872F|nr:MULTISPECIES: DUF559 domain-containing protein [unclassified Arthrobacter]MCQ9164876.1 DUF559 domain-containing protein [Arthrobacter sp. STN4]NVM98172.1 DUF559 domain-containing protein [Arthrobacter sp. SDTb3-6]
MFQQPVVPPALLTGPFTTRQAAELGVNYSRLRHADVAGLSRGIKSFSDEDLPLALLTRPYTFVTGYSAASHATAFAIWAFPGFLPVAHPEKIHIARQKPHAIPRRTGVTGHRTEFRDDEVECLNGLWITTRARTWLDCARRMGVAELVVVADHLIRVPRPEFEGRSAPYATRKDLELLLDRHKGTPGIRKARAALNLARVGSDSAQETHLRLAMGFAGLPEPDINVRVELAGGRSRTPDASFPRYRVAVEYDGGTHAGTDQQVRDIRRQEDYEAAGWIEVRIGKEHMKDDAKAAVRKIRRALQSRGWRPKPGPTG